MATKTNFKVLSNISRRILNPTLFNNVHYCKHIRSFSSPPNYGYDKDPAPYFLNPEVQKLLRVLTRPNIDKVFRQRKDGYWLEPPEYKFMTDAELEESRERALRKVDKKLQIPPVLKPHVEPSRVLYEDPALTMPGGEKFVFTDISLDVIDRERLVVVRDMSDGTLRTATAEERFRMNQIYFPMKGRELKVPPMFQDENLKPILDRGDYEYVLDRACLQYEPDDPEYHRVTSTTFEHINDHQRYEPLRSTRHFGSLTFYLAWNKKIDNLLLELIHTEKIEETTPLIKLLHILHPDMKSTSVKYENDDLAYLKAYVELDAVQKTTLEQAVRYYEELLQQRREVEEGIQKAHS